MPRWVKAEFPHCNRIGGFLILVDLLSGCGVGIGFVVGVGSREGGAGFIAGGGVMGESGECDICGGEMLTSVSGLVGVVGDVVSFFGV